ncbi:MAG: acyl-CoA dehydrogenase family protein [Oligoflexia bacterium]|nr:acyl-CoA dehydrogenase family protein [Oligoflexia bacterium]
MNYYDDSKEWKYLFRNAIDWDQLIPLYHKEFPTSDGIKDKEELIHIYEELLSTIADWAGSSVAERAKDLDLQGAGIVKDGRTINGELLNKFYAEAKNLGIFGTHIGSEYGGLNLPAVIATMTYVFVSRACISSSTQLSFFVTMADMIERFCDEDLKKKFIPKIINGEISGAMCLTESDAGSDIGSIKTTATKRQDGRYLLNGSKCFITNGGGGLGFVLARIKDAPQGLQGISLFFVEQEITNDKGESILNYRVTKNEEKIGLHGSFTCEIVYENSVARLVGEENKGLQIMFYLMNEARLGVGLQSLGGMEASVHLMREYASTRVQFSKILIELPLYKKILEDLEIECSAYRAFLVDTMWIYDVFQKLDMKKRVPTNSLTEDEEKLFNNVSKVIRKRTPLVKYYGAEAFSAISTKALQGFGGYGLMKDYPIERIHRDSFAPLLYEGTSQIQALMALKDLIKNILKNPSLNFFKMISGDPIKKFKEKNPIRKKFLTIQSEFKSNLAKLVLYTLKPVSLNKIFDIKSWSDEKKIEILMTHAETICQSLSYLETLKVLATHAEKDFSRENLFNGYCKIIIPRLAYIYSSWKMCN